jgi:hypothetical protein
MGGSVMRNAIETLLDEAYDAHDRITDPQAYELNQQWIDKIEKLLDLCKE